MKATVRNFLGIEAADLPLEAITLVGGHNGAGKTSLLDALAAGVTGDFATRGIRTKKDAGKLLRDGAPSGSVTIAWDDGAQRVAYPDADVLTKGEPRKLGTPLGIGAQRWMGLDAKERAREMAQRLRLEPTLENLRAFLKGKDVHEDTITAVWKLIDDQGWDGAHAKAKDKATKLRGAWEAAAGQKFGSSKAENYVPPILADAQVFTVEGAEAALAEAKKAAEALIVAGALAGAEVKRIRTTAEDLGPAKAREEVARNALVAADKAIEKMVADLAALPMLDQAVHTYPCPHCERPVWLKRQGPNEPYQLQVPPKEVPSEALKENRLARQALEHGIEKKKKEVDALNLAAQQAVAAVRAAEEATARLVEIDAMPKADDDAIAAARVAQAEAENVLEAVKDWLKAKGFFEDWQRTQPIIEALSPAGVRAARVAEAIEEFNRRLALISETAGFPAAVSLTATSDLQLGDRPYGLLSESEQWRCDLAMTLALAALERPVVVLVDRLDILHAQARPGVFEALREVGVPAVVGFTAKDTSNGALPKLQAHGYGCTYWLENGRLAPAA